MGNRVVASFRASLIVLGAWLYVVWNSDGVSMFRVSLF